MVVFAEQHRWQTSSWSQPNVTQWIRWLSQLTLSLLASHPQPHPLTLTSILTLSIVGFSIAFFLLRWVDRYWFSCHGLQWGGSLLAVENMGDNSEVFLQPSLLTDIKIYHMFIQIVPQLHLIILSVWLHNMQPSKMYHGICCQLSLLPILKDAAFLWRLACFDLLCYLVASGFSIHSLVNMCFPLPWLKMTGHWRLWSVCPIAVLLQWLQTLWTFVIGPFDLFHTVHVIKCHSNAISVLPSVNSSLCSVIIKPSAVRVFHMASAGDHVPHVVVLSAAIVKFWFPFLLLIPLCYLFTLLTIDEKPFVF